MNNKTSDKNVVNIEDDVMSQEAFNELIDNFEVVATLTMHGRKSIKHYVKEMQAEREQKDKRIQELEEQVKTLDEAYTGVIKESKKWFDIAHNSIPKQVVIDKIEGLRNDIKLGNCRYPYINEHKIDVLQELLREDK